MIPTTSTSTPAPGGVRARTTRTDVAAHTGHAELEIDLVGLDRTRIDVDGTIIDWDPPLLWLDGPRRDVLVLTRGRPLQRVRAGRVRLRLHAVVEMWELGWDPGPPNLAEALAAEAADAERLPRHDHLSEPLAVAPGGDLTLVVDVDPSRHHAVRVRWQDGAHHGVVSSDVTGSRVVVRVPTTSDTRLIRYEVDVLEDEAWAPVADAAPTFVFPLPSVPFARPRAAEFVARAGKPTLPEWVDGAVLYHVLVDRFARHDGEMASPDVVGHLGFAGGTIRGLIDRLDHLSDVGVDGVLCSPLTRGHMHLAYDVVDLCSVDPRLGTPDDVAELCDLAHRRGLVVLVDVELSYLGDLHPAAADGSTAVRSNSAGVPWGWYAGNPTFRPIDHGDTSIRSQLIESLDWWRALGVDGFRMDSAHAAPLGFWAEVGDHLDRADVFTFGEITQPHERRRRLRGRLGGYHDFDVERAVRDWVAGAGDGSALRSAVEAAEVERRCGLQPVTFFECHDDDRLAALVDHAGVDLAIDLLLALPGTPLLLQGTEIGQTQARRDPPEAELRAPMPWGRVDGARLAHVRRALARRRASAALRVGATQTDVVSGDVVCVRRHHAGELVEVHVNRSTRPVRLGVGGSQIVVPARGCHVSVTGTKGDDRG